MPWRERSAMDEKASFILEWQSAECSFSALCRSFGISRTLGYRYVLRFLLRGPPDCGNSRELRGGYGTARQGTSRRQSCGCEASGPASVH
jgi:hypothetical protein